MRSNWFGDPSQLTTAMPRTGDNAGPLMQGVMELDRVPVLLRKQLTAIAQQEPLRLEKQCP